jgi:hypothetical protein
MDAISYANTKGRKYFLHSRKVLLRSGYNHTAYYFALQVDPDRVVSAFPEGYEIMEGEQGLPFLKKRK